MPGGGGLPCRDRLIDAVVAALDGLTVGGRPVAVRIDMPAGDIATQDAPLLVMEADEEAWEQVSLGTDFRRLSLAVSLFEAVAPASAGADRSAAGAAALAALRQGAAMLRAAIETRLTAPHRLGGAEYPAVAADLHYADDVRLAPVQPPPERPGPFSDNPTAGFTLLFEVDYYTAAGDPFTFA